MGKIKYIPKKLIKKNLKKTIKLEEERNKARLQYPYDFRIYLADKYKHNELD
jgi:hypothetical protein